MYYTDDPIADFNAHEAYQERQLAKLPVCCECKEPIQSEFLFEIDDVFYCEECMDAHKHCTDRYIEE